MRRVFDCTEKGRKLRFYVDKQSDGSVTAMVDEPGDVRSHPIRLSARQLEFAERMFDAEQPQRVPHVNLDIVGVTDTDALALVELPDFFFEQLRMLSVQVARLNLQYPSHQERAAKCVEIAKEWVELGFLAAKLERNLREALTPPNDSAATERPQFFEASWGDGPFSFEDVEGFVKTNPKAGSQFHTTGGITFTDYYASTKSGRQSFPEPARSDRKQGRKRQFRWPLGSAASVLALLLSTIGRWLR